jgi:hypothetical protein
LYKVGFQKSKLILSPPQRIFVSYFFIHLFCAINSGKVNQIIPPYKTISCDFYDVLTHHALFKNEVEIIDIFDVIHSGVIHDVFTFNKEEFCLIGETKIRLDFIKSIANKINLQEYVQNMDCCSFITHL